MEDAFKTNAGPCTYTPGQALCFSHLRPEKPCSYHSPYKKRRTCTKVKLTSKMYPSVF